MYTSPTLTNANIKSVIINTTITLIIYSRLTRLNRHWIDTVHPLSEKGWACCTSNIIIQRWYFTVDYRC